MGEKYDFSGWAATNNVLCSDNTIIRPGAFKVNDGQDVRLVWQHRHDDIGQVLGHAILEERPKGMYAYCFLNEDTEPGRMAKSYVQHHDITSMSIWANQIKRRRVTAGPDAGADEILHGNIRELSLVLSPADPGAYIDYIAHSEDGTGDSDEAIIYNKERIDYNSGEIEHSDDGDSENSKSEEIEHAEEAKKEEPMADDNKTKETEDKDSSKKTVEDVVNSMTEEQQTVLKALMGKSYEQGMADAAGSEEEEEEEEDNEGEDNDDEGDNAMKHDVFDQDQENYYEEETTLSHSDLNDLTRAAIDDVKSFNGSFHDAFVAHATQDYGIGNIDLLFPDVKAVDNEPEFIKRETEWVASVMSGTNHTPFSRVKNLFADITADEARAKGYIKGKMKKEEFFKLSKRETTPTTVYKKQKLDRDDMVDVTTIDVVNWLMKEMRVMLDEEIARAILIGDGRPVSSEDKISEDHIRPIATDAELFTVEELLKATAPAAQVEEIAKTHKRFKGTGTPVFYTTAEHHTDLLWAKDSIGRRLYSSDAELCSALRVSSIVEVEVMENLTHEFSGRSDIADGNYELYGVKVNLKDYNVGTDKGGEINNFDDFDIDYNQYKYLMETRCSGALVKFHAAQAYWQAVGTAETEDPKVVTTGA